MESTPARTTDLADELEHVERAGLGQVHHDGAVHDEQAPAAASSSHGACAGPNLVPQQQCSTRQMASKPATSSSSNAVVDQKAARYLIYLTYRLSKRKADVTARKIRFSEH